MMLLRNRLILSALLTALHLAFSIICIGKADFLYADAATTRGWQIAFRIASFPIVSLEQLNYRGSVPKFLDFDWFLPLVVLNSLLWGVVLTVILVWAAKRFCKTHKWEG